MKSTKVFWQHLVLWVGAIVAISLLAGLIPGYETTWLGLRTSNGTFTSALLERISGALAIGALPAGIAASRHVISWQRSTPLNVLRFTTAPMLATLLVFVLVGFVAPSMARHDDPSPTPRLAGYEKYYSFNELLPASAHFLQRAFPGPRAFNPVERSKSEHVKSRFYFIIMWSLTPLLLAWIGVLVRLWSGLLSSQERALAEWLTALALLLGIQFTATGAMGWDFVRWGASPMMVAGSGRAIVIVPALVLIALAWTTSLARKTFAPATA